MFECVFYVSSSILPHQTNIAVLVSEMSPEHGFIHSETLENKQSLLTNHHKGLTIK